MDMDILVVTGILYVKDAVVTLSPVKAEEGIRGYHERARPGTTARRLSRGPGKSDELVGKK